MASSFSVPSLVCHSNSNYFSIKFIVSFFNFCRDCVGKSVAVAKRENTNGLT
jgi:hypothetical protein